jgi:hypothetical protein
LSAPVEDSRFRVFETGGLSAILLEAFGQAEMTTIKKGILENCIKINA